MSTLPRVLFPPPPSSSSSPPPPVVTYEPGTEKHILSIEECKHNIKWEKWKGYEIKTNTRTITFEISATQSCCEEWGVYITYPKDKTGRERDKEEMIGRVMGKVEWGPDRTDEEDNDTVQVYMNTSVGTILICAYNSHNGYYPHSVRLIEDGKTDMQSI